MNNILKIIQTVVGLVPAGLTAIEDIIAFIGALTTAISEAPGTTAHTQAVSNLSTLAAKSKTS